MHKHWTNAEWEAQLNAGSMAELAQIALAILCRLQKQGNPIVQICGPMTTGGFGDTLLNMEFFGHVVSRAEASGRVVFNQSPFQDSMIRICGWKEGLDSYPTDILDGFYAEVFASGYISATLFMPDYRHYKGFESSVGSRWEHERATKLGLLVDLCPVEWMADFRAFAV
jgi:hypothetical protein